MFSFSNIFAIANIINIVCVSSSTPPGGYYRQHSYECLGPWGGPGICMKLHECRSLENFFTLKESEIWLWYFLSPFRCGFEGIHPLVCCPVEAGLKHNPTYRKFLTEPCGAILWSGRVAGGKVAELHEFPWMALIKYKTNDGDRFNCAGSLISSRYVLTAAHCVTKLKGTYPIEVRLGEHNLESLYDDMDSEEITSTEKDIAIEEIIPHPHYSKRTFRHDIALIRLAEDVEFEKSIRPICLPLGKLQTYKGKAVVAGWGITERDKISTVLKKVHIPIVSSGECSRAYRNYPIAKSQICAGEPYKDSCKGDSGGPLQVVGLSSTGEPVYIQQGIVSMGPTVCGAKGIPGVYTKVSYYIGWILDTLRHRHRCRHQNSFK